MLFVKEEFLHNKIQKKEEIFGDLTTKHTERKVVRNIMKACDGSKELEKFLDPIME